jgi:hypothetical protein
MRRGNTTSIYYFFPHIEHACRSQIHFDVCGGRTRRPELAEPFLTSRNEMARGNNTKTRESILILFANVWLVQGTEITQNTGMMSGDAGSNYKPTAGVSESCLICANRGMLHMRLGSDKPAARNIMLLVH